MVILPTEKHLFYYARCDFHKDGLIGIFFKFIEVTIYKYTWL